MGAWVSGGAGDAGQVAIDGNPGDQLLAAFSKTLSGVIGQLRVEPQANEITAALELLKSLPLAGSIVTGDAIFAQRKICRVIVEQRGDYFFTVKDNRPGLKRDIALVFDRYSPHGPVEPAVGS